MGTLTGRQLITMWLVGIGAWLAGGFTAYKLCKTEIAFSESNAAFYKWSSDSWQQTAKGEQALRNKVEYDQDICSKNLKAEKVLYEGLARDFLLQEGRLKELEIAGRPRTCNMQQKLDCRLEWELLGDMHYNKCKNDLEVCQMSKDR